VKGVHHPTNVALTDAMPPSGQRARDDASRLALADRLRPQGMALDPRQRTTEQPFGKTTQALKGRDVLVSLVSGADD
jgi:hypothetical protein